MPNQHFMHVYKKPTIGSTFIRRFPAYQYRHKISANGGFDTASCAIAVTREEAEIIYQNYVGNRVAFFVDNPIEPIWEGYINRITLYAGSIVQTVSLDQMANRVIVQWSTGQGRAPSQTAEATDTTSIALYGSKMSHIDLGELYSTSTALPEAIRDALSQVRAYPQKSSVFTPGGRAGFIIEFEMLGFYHTLKWDTFSVVAADATNAPRTLFGAGYTYNDNIFYDLTNTNDILATTSYAAPLTRKAGESTWEMLLRLTEALSSSGRYIAGITPYNPNSGTRAGYFKAINTAINYAVDAYSDGRLRTIGGNLINPWDIRPDNYVLIRNLLLGVDATLDTGKIIYIKSVDYDAESGTVSWQSEDDITLQGVFNLNNKGALATNETFGAPPRWQVTSDYNIDSLTVTGTATMGAAVVTGDLSVGDDLTVTDRAIFGEYWTGTEISTVSAGAAEGLFTVENDSVYFVTCYSNGAVSERAASFVTVSNAGTIVFNSVYASTHSINASGSTVQMNNGSASARNMRAFWHKMGGV